MAECEELLSCTEGILASIYILFYFFDKYYVLTSIDRLTHFDRQLVILIENI